MTENNDYEHDPPIPSENMWKARIIFVWQIDILYIMNVIKKQFLNHVESINVAELSWLSKSFMFKI